METKQPTQEQIKEFWEWCGFKRDINNSHYYFGHSGQKYQYPDGRFGFLPSIDLNNLFKYAVPKLDNIKLVKNVAPSGDVFWNGTAEYIPDVKVVTHEDPALALFWAIWEVIHGS